MINVLADQYLYNIRAYLPESINLTLFDPAQGLSAELDSAHGLLIRTVNPINKQTLPDIPKQLSFVGTGSAGTDHVNIDYLQKNGIAFADAAGCNARSVAEYVATSLLIWAENRNQDWERLSVGVVGVGHVGTQVINLMDKLKISTVAYDPPREEREPSFTSALLDQLLDCDILSFHTPLTTSGNYPTFHWLDTEKLSTSNFQLIINTARGGMVNEQALLEAFEQETVKDFIIDVWEYEPEFNLNTAEQAFLKTPHIAGYSVQAKENASRLVADALLNHFGLPRLDNKKQSNSRIIEKNISKFDSLSALLAELHPIKEYGAELKKIIRDHPEKRGFHFNKLRAEFPLRQEFSQIRLPDSFFEKFPVLEGLGFARISAET